MIKAIARFFRTLVDKPEREIGFVVITVDPKENDAEDTDEAEESQRTPMWFGDIPRGEA